MARPKTYKEAKKETLAKWSRVLLLVERAVDTANMDCSFCRVPETECETCPAGSLCLSDTHQVPLLDLFEAREGLQVLVRRIKAIKLPKEAPNVL